MAKKKNHAQERLEALVVHRKITSLKDLWDKDAELEPKVVKELQDNAPLSSDEVHNS